MRCVSVAVVDMVCYSLMVNAMCRFTFLFDIVMYSLIVAVLFILRLVVCV